MMTNTTWKSFSLFPLLALAWLPAAAALARNQDAEAAPAGEGEGLKLLAQDSPSPLQRVFVPDEEPRPAVDREAWTRRLAVSDLDEREANLDELLARARSDDHLRLMLQEWSVDETDTQRAWTARLALRELAAEPPTARVLPSMPGLGSNPGFARLLDMQRELEDSLLRLNDPHFGGWFQGFDRDLDAIFGPSHLGAPGAVEESKSFSLEVGPDGVHCELSECIDGQEVKKEFSADTYEELLEANPELRDHLDSDVEGGFDFLQLEPPHTFGALPRPQVDFAEPIRTDRLGVQTRAPAEERVERAGLEEGQGLLVVRVLPRSIAAGLGIRRGDIVAEMDGVPIFGGLDVRRVLAERAADAELEVVVINARGQRRELVWKPEF